MGLICAGTLTGRTASAVLQSVEQLLLFHDT